MNVWVDYRFNLLDETTTAQLHVGTDDQAAVGVLTSSDQRSLCFMPQKQDFGLFFISLRKCASFPKQAGFSANGWHFVNLPLT